MRFSDAKTLSACFKVSSYCVFRDIPAMADLTWSGSCRLQRAPTVLLPQQALKGGSQQSHMISVSSLAKAEGLPFKVSWAARSKASSSVAPNSSMVLVFSTL